METVENLTPEQIAKRERLKALLAKHVGVKDVQQGVEAESKVQAVSIQPTVEEVTVAIDKAMPEVDAILNSDKSEQAKSDDSIIDAQMDSKTIGQALDEAVGKKRRAAKIADLEKAEARIKELEAVNKRLCQDVEELQSKLQQSQQEIVHRNTDIAMIQAKSIEDLSKAQDENIKLRNTVMELEGKLKHQLETLVVSKPTDCQKLVDENNQLRYDLNITKNRMDGLIAAMKAIKAIAEGFE
jgi:hypothetical protein